MSTIYPRQGLRIWLLAIYGIFSCSLHVATGHEGTKAVREQCLRSSMNNVKKERRNGREISRLVITDDRWPWPPGLSSFMLQAAFRHSNPTDSCQREGGGGGGGASLLIYFITDELNLVPELF